MTVSSTTSSVSYAGDGATTIFPVSFYFLDGAHVKAVLRDDSSGSETPWTQPADFAIAGAGEQAGGTLTATAAPASGRTLLIYRDVPATQETDYVENDPFPAESHERALDKVTMIVQQLGREISRSFRLKISDPTDSIELPDVEMRKGKYLFFDPATGEPSVASVVAVGSLVVSAFWQSVLDENNAAASRAVLEAAGLNVQNVFTAAEQILRSTDSGSGPGPIARLIRDSASPAAFDLCGSLSFDGRNSAATQKTMANLVSLWLDVAAGSEDGQLLFQTMAGGALTNQMALSSGLALAGATDGAKGAGTINAQAYFANGAALPFTRAYQSSNLSCTPGGTGTLAHGLGARPKLYMSYLVCTSVGELGYGVGDEIPISHTDAENYGVTLVTTDAAGLSWVVASGGIRILNKSTGADAGITASRWRHVARAWA